MFKRSFFVVLFLMLVFVSTALAVENISRENPENYVPGEILVGFKPEATPGQIDAAVARVGGEVIGTFDLPTLKIRRVRIFSATQSAMEAAMNDLRTAPLASEIIKIVEPNLIRQAHQAREPSGDAGILSQSNDPLLSQQWGYYDIGANWINVQTVAAPVVAVIDTGVDYTHPDLAGKVIKGYDFVNDDADPMDDHGHGTHVAGVIAALTNNAYGTAGISWNSKILAVKVLNSQGYGYVFEIAKGIAYAADNPSVKVINMSLGGGASSIEQEAVSYAVVTKKKLLIAAAGNDNSSTPPYPAAYSTLFPSMVLAVAAHGTDHCRASFSNYGPWVSITAPGVNILSTVPPLQGYDGFVLMSGTSMAAPHVAGAAAVAWGKFPTYTNQQIGDLLMTRNSSSYSPLNRNGTCWPADGSTFGRLDVFYAVEPALYEACDLWPIYGYAMDGESGEPLTGAKVTAKIGATVAGTEYVPYIGEMWNPYFDFEALEGYGLFHMMVKKSSPTESFNLTIKKPKFTPVTVPNIMGVACNWSYAGNIPVPPSKPYYWLAITWNYGYFTTNAKYDAILFMSDDDPNTDYDPIFFGNRGDLSSAPWAKLFWDDYSESGNLRASSEVIRIKKMMPGTTYQFSVLDELNGPGSISWGSSGIKAYIFRWDPLLSRNKLVATFTPPTGTGAYWDICTIKGNAITTINSFHN